MFQIRQADECDIRDLVDLDDECFDTYYYRANEAIRLKIKNNLTLLTV